MDRNSERYIPALRYGWLTSSYDTLIRWTARELTFKRRLVATAGIAPGQRVLDLGCGTATLTIMVKKRHPEAEVVGLDGDPKILSIARAKAVQAGVDITLETGMSYQLPYTDHSFDQVLSSLLFHHLTRQNKLRTVNEVFRVLRPGGELYLADLSQPSNVLMSAISLIIRWFEETRDNIAGRLPEMLRRAGFTPVEELTRYMTVFGTLAIYRARKPDDEGAKRLSD